MSRLLKLLADSLLPRVKFLDCRIDGSSICFLTVIHCLLEVRNLIAKLLLALAQLVGNTLVVAVRLLLEESIRLFGRCLELSAVLLYECMKILVNGIDLLLNGALCRLH